VTLLLMLCLAFAVLPFVFEHPYREWLFRRAEHLQVVVYCDTTVLQGPIRAIAMYDDLALRFIPRSLGMFQNRPAGRVKTFCLREVRVGKVSDYFLELEDVPDGPLVRIMVRDAERRFSVEVQERKIHRGQLSVWAQP